MPQPAKSARLQLLDGNPNKKNVAQLKKRAEVEKKLTMPNNNIKPPKWLTKNGVTAFNAIKKELIAVELIANVDTYHLSLYADSYAKYVEMNAIISDEGLMNDEGEPHPLLVRMEKQASQMRTFGSDLGLSPAARAKLAIKLADEEGEPEWD